MGQLSLFDAFGSEPNSVPKPPRPPKRHEKVIVENSPENKAESKPETPAFVIEAPIHKPLVAAPANPTPASGLYYEPPLYETPIFEVVQPLTEPSKAAVLVVEEKTDVAPTPTEIDLPDENKVSVIEEKPMIAYSEEAHIQDDVKDEHALKEIPESVSEPVVERMVAATSEAPQSTAIKTKTVPKPKTKVVPPMHDNIQDEAPCVIDVTSLTKQYYSISEVAKLFGVNASHLRYWEKEFPTQLGNVRKNGKGDRFYTPKNIEQLQIIFHLVRNKKMTLEGARKQLKLKKKSLKSEADAYDLMQQVRRFLVELKRQLD